MQYKYYADMAHSTNHHAPAVNETGYELMKAATAPCIAAIDACQTTPASCLIATDLCNLALIEPYQLSGRNPYDMRIKCAVPPLCYDFSNVATYLARPEVVAYLGVAGHKWQDCNRAVAVAFELGGDWMHDFQQDIPDQLAAGIRVLMYAGDQVRAARARMRCRSRARARPYALATRTHSRSLATRTHSHALARTLTRISGLHLQLAREPGVDERAEVARSGAIQRERVAGGVVRRRQSGGRAPQQRRLLLPPRVRRGTHGAPRPTRCRVGDAQRVHLRHACGRGVSTHSRAAEAMAPRYRNTAAPGSGGVATEPGADGAAHARRPV